MFSHRIRFAALLGLLLVTLACSLGGGAVTPTAEPTDEAQLVPTREAPTVPPVWHLLKFLPKRLLRQFRPPKRRPAPGQMAVF